MAKINKVEEVAEVEVKVPVKEEKPVAKVTPKFTVDVEKLNVRKAASVNSDILKVLEKNAKITGNKKGEWIELENGEGFVMAKFVK